MFTAPPEATLEWNDAAVEGSYRFLRRVWAFAHKHEAAIRAGCAAGPGELSAAARGLRHDIHAALKQANYDYERMQYNTVVSAAMKMLNTLEAAALEATPSDQSALAECLSILLRVLYPISPHLTQVLWNELGYVQGCGGALLDASWPQVDETALARDEVELMLQVGGKLRGSFRVPATAGKDEIERAAVQSEAFVRFANGAQPRKIVVVPGRLVNVVI
jgi:leucyl-tRNA synthetase